MASITQQPNEFNLAVGPNVWTLGTLGSANRFVLGVEINGSIVTTLKQTPNPAGVGIFDINLILQSYLSNAFVESTEKFAPTPGGAIRYRIRYGSETGSTITWNGYSGYKVVLNGYKAFNDLNWIGYGNYIPFMEESECESLGNPYTSCPIAEVNFLTSYPGTINTPGIAGVPAQPVTASTNNEYNEIATLNFAAFHQQSWTSPDTYNKAPWAVIIRYYNAANSNYYTQAYSLYDSNGYMLRGNCSAPIGTITNDYLMGTIGTGPRNLWEAGLFPTNAAQPVPAYYTVELWTKGCGTIADCTDVSEIIDGVGCLWAIHAYQVVDYCTKFEPVRLSFLNEFGGRDYYTFTKRNTYTEAIQRNTYFRDAGSWSGSTYSVNSYERGTQTFNQTVQGRMFVSTDWVEDNISLWLEKLYTSPEVKMWTGGANGEWIAVTIADTSYQQKTAARDNKIYRYELNLEYSQPQTRQRG
jgi:hypothetical protein